VAAPLFAFERVGLERDGTRVLDDVSVDVPTAGITVFVGPSGAGKSTLLRCCNRLEEPTSGVVRFRGTPLVDLDPLAHRRRVGMVFQAPARFPGTVGDNLRAVAADLTDAEAADLLDRVGLDPGLLDRSADALSGGEAQRMVLARALTTEPEVLLADEPTSALDATATTRLEELARDLAADGMPVLWVTHDQAQVRRLADHLVVLRSGRVVWSGPASSTEAADALRAAS
jgi:putative ABC transport system ATP-binding protein